MKELYLKAPAKINLALHVKNLREDGFHELEMIMQSISLADRIKLKKKSGGIIIKNSQADLPTGSENLAYQAAEIFFANNPQINKGVEIYIEKNIPIAAGMAGGSTDAAAVLRGLYQLFDLEINLDFLRQNLVEIGSDVPYCLEGGTVFAAGKGEILEKLPFLGEKYLVVVTPNFRISTPKVYKLYDEIKGQQKFDFDSVLANLKKEEKVNWSLDYKNDLTQAAEQICPEIKEVKDIFKNTAAEFTLVSGSGPTVFSIYENRKQAEKVAAAWPRKNDFVTAVKTIPKY
ncbi:4-(cytidine 5'-diphospho)-2-C-methyl-D-erythritol kinase [Halanaerobium praevalens]|uniref:4-diphosphocytidyl-2-C-methyl-D-erythritol kinase n=1 Tax=Halanaerobium praevalens (strain ATCC 33744 / DSM 2228 / GSL) TaxID=572479 RepID=E3DQA5_HALPG|nr:4-(cytidine 5'-diphospho)-2-C-methyl-D-erythritol kinase [Halanaerobium praevalens]ADO77882.1 4-diphosphocytidyl-2C-methyl-D-erythritol kinase [Halanaerobium praevalens DSM 2228]